MTRMRASSLLSLPLMMVVLAACGDDEADPAGGGGSGGDTTSATGGEGGAGGEVTPAGDIASVSAPTRTQVQIDVTGSMATAPVEAAAYQITSEHGPLVVTAVSVDGQRILLETEKQKLGVTYELVVAAPGSDLDLEGDTFLAADTAAFWTSDFGNNFQAVEVTAKRVGVGEHVVLYAIDDVSPTDIAETIQVFDETVFPAEVELLHAAPDRDDNGRIVLLGLDGDGYYAGYFNPLDSLPAETVEQWGYKSNEMEMLYISIPDTQGKFDPWGVIPHELSHLLYNEEHDITSEDWSWHNEGLAECAVKAVHGSNDTATYWFLNSPDLATGKSLVQWEYANYAQYVQAYVFWTYVAGRLGGVAGYGELFDQSGDPAAIDAFFQAELGQSFADVQLDMMTAAWVEAPSGPYGFNGMLALGADPQASSVDSQPALSPFEAVFLTGASGAITPAGQGPDVRIRGVDASGAITDAAPFNANGGVMIVLNALQDPGEMATQPGGTFPAALPVPAPGPRPSLVAGRDPAWRHPPPIKPANKRLLERWLARTRP
jgi:hypothetical protein